MNKIDRTQNYSNLIADLASIIEQGRKLAVRYVNTALVTAYWLIGRRIVEFEQKGKERAEYGKRLLEKLSNDLTKKFGRGFSSDNLEAMRNFYLTYKKEISETVSRKLEAQKSDTMSRDLPTSSAIQHYSKRFVLSWSHYRLLMRLDEPFKREFYEAECIRGNWSVRQLDRQIQSMLYERTALSKKKLAVISKAHEKPIALKPEDEIKDPYILEFLGLKDEYSESQLEEALIKHLEHFLLELGIGFTFIARQKRITLEGSHYRLDLLFYHRVLRCLIAIDLKIGEFTHADAGQMNLYLN
jgi:predicted nuclease of restriction endonuclease-like (RecB) superfamily